MSLNEKIGQMVIIGLEGTKLQKKTSTMLEKYRVGGFILYKRNIESAQQTQSLLNELKAANQSLDDSESTIPLWLSVDEEGGIVTRMPESFIKLPAPRSIGQTGNPDYAYEINSSIGYMLSELGFNLNYAPVLDIDSNPDNPVIGKRSFGRDADTVTDLGISAMKGLQDNNITAVIKHFPGHGDTSVDSHYELPVVRKTLQELEELELLPFQNAIEAGADVVMIAHILLPELDAELPSSLSSKVIDGLLRDKLGYEGVVITDDMTMGGITEYYDIGDAAVRSIQAGSDIILVGHKEKLQAAALDALLASAADGTLTEKRIDESVYRILQLKQKYKLEDTARKELPIERINESLQKALQSK